MKGTRLFRCLDYRIQKQNTDEIKSCREPRYVSKGRSQCRNMFFGKEKRTKTFLIFYVLNENELYFG